ncbi:hypothetical protein [Blastococcus deserti]|uniref:Uncharacterized protein n=1 Tax=Blastococcus deserti TaxID=2259033 RepID=A0ABW4XCZ7_9ACTN
MTDRPRDDRPRSPSESIADPTRDIRLPPLPDRPAPDLPRGWAAPAPAAQPAGPDLSWPPPDPPDGVPVRSGSDLSSPPPDPPDGVPARPEGVALADQPTDQLGGPAPARQKTLAFEPAEPPHGLVHAGAAAGPAHRSADVRGRRWPWVLLTVLPVLVILGAGVAWLLLLRGV